MKVLAASVRAKSASVTAVLNCANVQVIPTIFVWSHVFVPLLVPENVPLCVASVPSQRVVLCADASVSSRSAFQAAVTSQPSFVVVIEPSTTIQVIEGVASL